MITLELRLSSILPFSLLSSRGHGISLESSEEPSTKLELMPSFVGGSFDAGGTGWLLVGLGLRDFCRLSRLEDGICMLLSPLDPSANSYAGGEASKA